jgi:hypothetical protein
MRIDLAKTGAVAARLMARVCHAVVCHPPGLQRVRHWQIHGPHHLFVILVTVAQQPARVAEVSRPGKFGQERHRWIVGLWLIRLEGPDPA